MEVRSVFGEEPDDNETQEALRKQQRRLDDEDRMHRRMFGIRSPEELARNLGQKHRKKPMPEEVVRDLQESLRKSKPNK